MTNDGTMHNRQTDNTMLYRKQLLGGSDEEDEEAGTNLAQPANQAISYSISYLSNSSFYPANIIE